MSVIACEIGPKKIYLAADSQKTKGNGRRPELSFKKIVKIKDVVVSTVGTCQECQLLYEYIKGCTPPNNQGNLLLYMSEFYKWRNSINPKLEPEDKDSLSDIQVLLIMNGTVFHIDGLYIDIVNCFFAMGSGEEYALGAMENGASVKEAVRIACKYNINCSLPIQYMEVNR